MINFPVVFVKIPGCLFATIRTNQAIVMKMLPANLNMFIGDLLFAALKVMQIKYGRFQSLALVIYCY